MESWIPFIMIAALLLNALGFLLFALSFKENKKEKHRKKKDQSVRYESYIEELSDDDDDENDMEEDVEGGYNLYTFEEEYEADDAKDEESQESSLQFVKNEEGYRMKLYGDGMQSEQEPSPYMKYEFGEPNVDFEEQLKAEEPYKRIDHVIHEFAKESEKQEFSNANQEEEYETIQIYDNFLKEDLEKKFGMKEEISRDDKKERNDDAPIMLLREEEVEESVKESKPKFIKMKKNESKKVINTLDLLNKDIESPFNDDEETEQEEFIIKHFEPLKYKESANDHLMNKEEYDRREIEERIEYLSGRTKPKNRNPKGRIELDDEV